jgi:hypothetical protein
MQHSAPAAANLLAASGDNLPILRFAHHPALETCDSDNEICLHALYLLQILFSSSSSYYDDFDEDDTENYICYNWRIYREIR